MNDDRLTGYFAYLDKLQKLAIVTNTQASAYFLEARFMLDYLEAKHILQAWQANQQRVIVVTDASGVGGDVQLEPRT